MSGPPLFDPARLAACLAQQGFDAVLAAGAPNVRYLTRFSKPAGALALVTARSPERPRLVLPAANVDFLVEDLADGVEPIAYGRFYRFRDDAAALRADEALVDRVSETARAEADAHGLAAELVREAGLERGRIALDLPVGGLAEALPGARLEHAPALLRRLRAVKTGAELARLREAARIAEQAIVATVAAATPGATQKQLARVFCAAIVGRSAAVRLDNVSLGRSSALGNANVPTDVLERGDVLRFDVGAVYRGYCSDLSRCFSVGPASGKVARYHAALVAGQRAALAAVRPEARPADVFDVGRSAVREAGIPHYERTNLGHGIGLAGDGYDAPLLAPDEQGVLEEGMVLCVETPYYELGFGGLQVEDMVHVTAEGWEPLSELPRELEEIG